MSECIKVAIRSRPLSKQEIKDNNKEIVDINNNSNEVKISNIKRSNDIKRFTYDYSFDKSSSQKEIYEKCVFDLVEKVFEGYNGTIFAYGQTGTGKTHTMQGDKTEELKGIIPRTFDHIFQTIQGTDGTNFLVTCSMIEIYNEKIRDLLANTLNKECDTKENTNDGTFYVKDLKTFDMKNAQECLNLLKIGSKKRVTKGTNMNDTSSRSHCIFTIIIESSKISEDGTQDIRKGKLNLVDWAGSEKLKKTDAKGKTMIEGNNINLSLNYLGKVISALVKKESHIPYRNSKLTKLLKDSLGGNTKTIMIANIGPSETNYEESISTLRYANQAKNIKNKPIINTDPKDAKLSELQDEISKLKDKLKNLAGGDFDISNFKNNPNFEEAIMSQLNVSYIKNRENYEKKINNIIESKKYSEKEKEELLKKHKLEEVNLDQIKKQNEEVFKRMKQMENKILTHEKNEKEFENIKKVIEVNRNKNDKLKEKRKQMEQETEEYQVEKINLEKKYQTQQEELVEKEKIVEEINKRYQQVKNEYKEVVETNESENKQLEEEYKNILEYEKINDTIIKSYFLNDEYTKLKENFQICNINEDGFKFINNTSQEIMDLYNNFELQKKLAEDDYYNIKENEEIEDLFGDQEYIYNKIDFKTKNI